MAHIDTHRSTEIQISSCSHLPTPHLYIHGRSHSLQRDTGTRNQRFKQHLPATQLARDVKIIAAGCRVETCYLLFCG